VVASFRTHTIFATESHGIMPIARQLDAAIEFTFALHPRRLIAT
jgi:hypothetical protein